MLPHHLVHEVCHSSHFWSGKEAPRRTRCRCLTVSCIYYPGCTRQLLPRLLLCVTSIIRTLRRLLTRQFFSLCRQGTPPSRCHHCFVLHYYVRAHLCFQRLPLTSALPNSTSFDLCTSNVFIARAPFLITFEFLLCVAWLGASRAL